MDSLRGFDDNGWSAAHDPVPDEEPVIDERPPLIGVDERRMHVRAYNYWVSLLNGRPYPSIDDVRPDRLGDFGPHSVLLDFGRDPEDPDIAFLGHALSTEIGLGADVARISEVPARSLLSRLTDHYMQIIANRAPIGFEAEFVNIRGNNTFYRGILMPLSTNGDEIDFVYGVINWKELADADATGALAGEVDRAIAAAPDRNASPIWADGPNGLVGTPAPQAEPDEPHGTETTLSLWPEEGEDEDTDSPPAFEPLGEDAGLADHLELARQGADLAREADQRSRAALYRALSLAYDFALATEAAPEDFAELLEDAGLKAQARAPMTPIVKLVFGAQYDKTRLTEYAAALSHARRTEIAAGGFFDFIDSTHGGLKALVSAERALRRPVAKPDPAIAARARVKAAPALAHVDAAGVCVGVTAGEIVLLVGRAEADGSLAIVSPAVTDPAIVSRLIARMQG